MSAAPRIAPKIAPCLWFDGQAEVAATLYTSLFPDSGVGAVSRYTANAPYPPGTAMVVEFMLAGNRFQALNGGPQFTHSEAMSLSIDCTDQSEVDHYWDGLTKDGGRPGRCGWLKDPFGVSWQVVPAALGRVMSSGDADARRRAATALQKMSKIDIAALEAASRGETA